MRRTRTLLVIGFAVFVFLGISALLARALSGAGDERARVLDIARAETRGDAAAVLAGTPACAVQPACAATTREFVVKLRRPGAVEILQYVPSIQVALTRTTGTARVAWRAGRTGFPVVQCVRVTRDGPLTGGDVTLLSISAPIPNESACPS
jgi:hypothetical protein